MKKKILSILLSAIFVLSLVPSTMVADTIETEPMEPIPAENVYEKFHFYTGDYSYAAIEDSADLSAAIGSVKATARSEVSRAAGTAAEEEPITVIVEFDSGFRNTPEFQAFNEERYELETQEEVLNFRQRLNSFSKAYHRAEAQVNQQALVDLGYETIDHIDYSPFFRLEMNAADIDMDEFVSMASSDNVLHVSFSEKMTVQNSSATSDYVFQGETSWNGAMEAINASAVAASYNGTGVRIGVLEAWGVCDSDSLLLADKNIFFKNEDDYPGVDLTPDDHATFVVEIIAAMAPEASFYVAELGDAATALDWFIANNCDIVNCSFADLPAGTPTPTSPTDVTVGYSYAVDSIYDYQITNHYLTVVAAAGNVNTNGSSMYYNPNGTVTSPANAFNAIAVGGLIRTPLDDDNLFFSLEHADLSCYQRGNDGSLAKPEISAMFEIEDSNHTPDAGTSYSAPQVTAAVALMIDKTPSYSTLPELVKAVLMATSTKTDDHINNVSYLDDRTGSGCLNVWESVYHPNTKYTCFSDQGTAGQQVRTRTISLSSGQELQVALVWLMDISSDLQSRSNTDYDIRIYSANDLENPITASLLGIDSNVEFVRFTAPSAGNYVIEVYRYGAATETKFLALAYE